MAGMAGTYNRSQLHISADAMMAALARIGIAPGGITSLTVVGRRSGRPHTLPITPITVDGRRYLVAPYGPVGWVLNLRAAGHATLKRGRRRERIRAIELAPPQAAPVLRAYAEKIPLVRPQFAAAYDDPLEDFVAIAPKHPVFALTPVD